jgi:hypothetical protein
MRKINVTRACPVLFLLLLPLLLSGCQNGIFGGLRNLFHRDAETAEVAGGNGKPVENDYRGAAPAVPMKAEEPPPVIEDKLPAQLIDLKNPEDIMPLAYAPGPDNRSDEEAGPADITYRNATLTEDTTWRGKVLIEGGVTIAAQTTVTVEEGTVVRFRGVPGSDAKAALVVLGRIVVKGTVAMPVSFTSTHGQSMSGDWLGIVLTGSGKRNQLEHFRVDGAETGIDASFSTLNMKNAVFARCRTGARLQDTVVVIDGMEAGECGTGLILYDSEADIRSANLFGNRLGIYAARTSLSLAQSRFTGNNLLALAAFKSRVGVSGNSFTANGSGISLVGCEGEVSTDSIVKNAAYGILLKDSRVKVSANDIEGNGKAGLRVEDGKGVAWGNVLYGNGEYDLYNGSGDEFRAIGNWWGSGSPKAIAARIYDRSMDEGRGKVLFFPPLQTRPDTAPPP